MRVRIKAPKEKIDRKNTKEYYHRMRNALKKDETRYKKIKEEDAQRNRNARRNMTEEKRAKYNEGAKFGMRGYRERKKSQNNNSKMRTRSEKEKLGEVWRLAKRRQREKLTAQVLRRYNEKRKNWYKKNKAKKALKFESPKKNIESQLDASIHMATPNTKDRLEGKGFILSPRSMKCAATDKKIVLSLKETERINPIVQRLVVRNTKSL